MTVRGFLREMEAAQRRAERERLRRERQIERERKQMEKMEEMERAAYEVEIYEERIENLLSIHRECAEDIDWEWIDEGLFPIIPDKPTANAEAAQEIFDGYEASLFDTLFFRVGAKRRELYDAIDVGRSMDAEEYALQLRNFELFFKDWEWKKLRADYVLAGDIEVIKEVIETIGPFRDITDLGSQLKFILETSSQIEVDLEVKGKEVIPSEVKTLLKTGKLSEKKMPVMRFNELYQDYICGCAIRIARELFALLPFEKVFVHAVGEILNSKTGYLESKPILSVVFPRETMGKLNYEMLDPSDSMQNFIHHMDFKVKTGFDIVEKINPGDLRDA